jgi:VCBS repeat protein
MTFTTALATVVVHLHARVVENRRPGHVRAAIVAVTALLFVLPVAAVVATQDLSCDVTGFTQRGDSDWALVGALALVLLAALGPLALAAGEPHSRAWRLTALASGALVPAVMIEGVISLAALHLYCDGSPGVLYAQAGLAIAIPAVLLGRALWSEGTPSPAGRSAVAAAVVLLLPAPVALVVARSDDGPLTCVAAGALDASAREAVGSRGADTDLELAAADFDRDGSIDLAGADTTGRLRVLSNDGSGGLRPGPGTDLVPGFYAVGPLAAADLDGDGQTDVAVTGVESGAPPAGRSRLGAVAVVRRDGSSFRAFPPLFLDDDDLPRDLAVGDLDGDGAAEIVVLDGTTAVVLRDAGGRLEEGARLTGRVEGSSVSGDRQWRLALADADGDGRTDVLTLVLGAPGAPSAVVVHRNDGTGRFESSVLALLDDYVPSFTPGDFDGDGDIDVVAAGSERGLHLLVNEGNGRFEHRVQPTKAGAERIAAADVNGDGSRDLVLGAEYSSEAAKWPGELWVRLNRRGWEFSRPERLAKPRTLLAVADLDGDRRADFVVDDIPDVVVLRSVDCP